MSKELMDALRDIENQLGWLPPGDNIYKARAIQHNILERAMARKHYTMTDLRLAINLCKHKRMRIDSPLQLLPLIPEARELGPERVETTGLDTMVKRAVKAEYQAHDSGDKEAEYWITRFSAAVGPQRRQLLAEWQQAGRGHV